jgi:hypothetical protein
VSFTRTIVYPNVHKEIEGVTPKALPGPEKIDVIEAPKLSEE